MTCVRLLLPAGIAVTAPLSTVVTVDPSSGKGMNYSIESLNSTNVESVEDTVSANRSTFYIGPSNGTVYTNALMTEYRDHYFVAGLKATGVTGMSDTAHLWVRYILLYFILLSSFLFLKWNYYIVALS